MSNVHPESEKKTAATTKYPADKKKGEAERRNAEQHAGSNAGEDESSGSEVIEEDPTRFPHKERG